MGKPPRPDPGGRGRDGPFGLAQALERPERFAAKPFPGVSLDALKFLHLERRILFHGHEPLDTDTTPTLEGESWLLHNHFTQAEGVANLDQVPEAGALITIGFAAAGRHGRLRPLRGHCPAAARRHGGAGAGCAVAQAAGTAAPRR